MVTDGSWRMAHIRHVYVSFTLNERPAQYRACVTCFDCWRNVRGWRVCENVIRSATFSEMFTTASDRDDV